MTINENKTRIAITIDNEDYNTLKELCKKNNKSKSTIISELLKENKEFQKVRKNKSKKDKRYLKIIEIIKGHLKTINGIEETTIENKYIICRTFNDTYKILEIEKYYKLYKNNENIEEIFDEIDFELITQ